MTQQWERWWPWLFFGGITTLIVYPWFTQPGYLFLLDFVWTPQLPSPAETIQHGIITGAPFQWLFRLLSSVIPTDIVQKSALAASLYVSAVSLYQLMRWILRQYSVTTQLFAAGVAATFYVINPFVVSRLFMGQYYVLLAYAFTPWVVLAWLKHVTFSSWRTSLTAGGITAVTILASIHHAFLLPLLGVLLLPRNTFSQARPTVWVAFLAPLLLTVALIVGVYTRAPASLRATSDSAGSQARIPQALFTSTIWLDSLLLSANWKNDLPFLFPNEAIPYYNVGMGILLGTMFVAFTSESWWQRWLTRRLFVLLGINLFLAVGLASPLSRGIMKWLYTHLPFWFIMRDSGKFLAVVALAESILLGCGLAVMLSHRKAWLIKVSLLVIMMYLSFPVWFSFHRQIEPAPYPASWYAWNEQLAQVSAPTMLFLPWHRYMPFPFTDDRTVVNPAPSFFTHANVVASHESEVGRPPLPAVPESVFTEWLSQKQLDYVAFAPDTLDAKKYEYLSIHPQLTLVFRSPELLVWQTKAPAP